MEITINVLLLFTNETAQTHGGEELQNLRISRVKIFEELPEKNADKESRANCFLNNKIK